MSISELLKNIDFRLVLIVLDIIALIIKKYEDYKKEFNEAENDHSSEKAESYFLDTRLNNENKSSIDKEMKSIKTIRFISAEKSKIKYKPEYYTMSDGQKIKIDKGIVLEVS